MCSHGGVRLEMPLNTWTQKQQRVTPGCSLLNKGRHEGTPRAVGASESKSVLKVSTEVWPGESYSGCATRAGGPGSLVKCAETKGGLCVARDHTHARPPSRCQARAGFSPCPELPHTGCRGGGSLVTSPSDAVGKEKGGRRAQPAPGDSLDSPTRGHLLNQSLIYLISSAKRGLGTLSLGHGRCQGTTRRSLEEWQASRPGADWAPSTGPTC